MLLAMENGVVAFLVVHAPFWKRWLGRIAGRVGDGLPGAKTDPGAELLACGLHVVEPNRLAVLLELVLNLWSYCHGFRTGQVNAAILEFSVVVDQNRHQAAGLGVFFRASPFKDPD
jgi:hypothetical protein